MAGGKVTGLGLLRLHQSTDLRVKCIHCRIELIQTDLCLLHRGGELRYLGGNAGQRRCVLGERRARGADLSGEGTLLCDQRVEGLLLGGELCGERLLLSEGVVKRVAANWSSLRQTEANNQEGGGEQNAESGAPRTCSVRRRRRVLHA